MATKTVKAKAKEKAKEKPKEKVKEKDKDKEKEVETSQYCRTEVIAQMFGVSVRRVQQLVQEGIISTVKVKEGKRFDLIPTIQAYIKHLSDKAYGKSKSENEAKLKEQKLKADIALKESQGELHRLRTDIAAGKYITVEEVKLDYSRFFLSFKKFAMSLPSKCAGRLAGFVDPVEVRQIESELRKDMVKLLKGFVVNTAVEEAQENDGKA